MVPAELTPRYLRLPSKILGREVHLWQYGHYGPPVIAFPTAGGYAHEWQAQGVVDALADRLRAGGLKLYCPETNVSRTWTGQGSPAERLSAHAAYERFLLEELVPYIEADCRTPGIPLALSGCSLGALYATTLALRHPERFHRAFGFSGRYATEAFLGPYDGLDAYYHTPLAFVPNLQGDALARIRRHTRLTLVCGQGAFEGRCLPETVQLGQALKSKGVRVHLDLWGKEVSHTWGWWKVQIQHHLGGYRLPATTPPAEERRATG
jgi:esterase/lipase superfamily enzyme